MNEERWWRRISGSSSICLFNAFRLTKAFRNWNYRKIQIGRSSRRMYLPSYSSCMQSTWKCISILLLIFFSAWVCTHHNNVGEITQNSLIATTRDCIRSRVIFRSSFRSWSYNKGNIYGGIFVQLSRFAKARFFCVYLCANSCYILE